MRDIIFRGKRTRNAQWVEGSLLVYADGDCFICCKDVSPDVLNKYEVDPATVGQYSGLVDNSGKRIFEGDILKVEGLGHPKDMKTIEVGFSEGAFSYKFRGDWIAFADGEYGIPLKDVEVIGNIHDNPELLQG